MANSPKPQVILVIEDNDDDFEATERALKKDTKLLNPIRRCRDGMEAWSYLKREPPFAEPKTSPRPGLILLDLNMPGLDGRRLLRRLKSDDSLRTIPTVIMTTSEQEEDVDDCYYAGANSYVRKPVSWPDFSRAVAGLREYWLEISVLPTRGER